MSHIHTHKGIPRDRELSPCPGKEPHLEYMDQFKAEWEEVCKRLRTSGKDLENILITAVGMKDKKIPVAKRRKKQ